MATTTEGTPPLSRIPEDRPSSLELVRITEAAAIAAAHWMGHGDNNSADQAAVEAMRRSMEDARFNGRIVIGEGERDEAPMLYIGEKVGRGDGPQVDIAVDALEGTNLVAKGRPNAIAVMAVSEAGGLLHAPDTYMEKLVVGPPAKGKVSLDRPVKENLKIIADSLGRDGRHRWRAAPGRPLLREWRAYEHDPHRRTDGEGPLHQHAALRGPREAAGGPALARSSVADPPAIVRAFANAIHAALGDRLI